MDPIKINVDVNVHLSDDTRAFFAALMFGNNTNSCKCASAVEAEPPRLDPVPDKSLRLDPVPAEPETTHESSKTKTIKKVKAKVKPAEENPVAEETAAASEATVEEHALAAEQTAVAEETAAASEEYTDEDVRAAMKPKIGDHRAALAAKIKELGGQNVTSLPVNKRGEFIDFCNSLA